LAAADFIDLPLSRHAIEFVDRQRREELDAVSSALSASRNALRRSISVPSTAAGSGTPQCAVIGLPGHTGQTSPAAWSQTVNTKSITGASGRTNSSQLLLRSPSVRKPSFSSSSTASGCTLPLGKLPALKPLKRPFPQCSTSTSARVLRAELPVQRNRTL
jgi:hypothetical protein